MFVPDNAKFILDNARKAIVNPSVDRDVATQFATIVDRAELFLANKSGSGELELSAILSAFAELPRERGDILGPFGSPFRTLDPRWVQTVINRVTSTKVAFPLQIRGPILAGTSFSIAVAGDWGTRLPAAMRVMDQMQLRRCDYTLHLGDVYYSGTTAEESEFVKSWRPGVLGAFALNSNHEMYSGGEGYFCTALRSRLFELQGGASYFAVANESVLLLGIDSAYSADGPMFGSGMINSEQKDYLRALVGDSGRFKDNAFVVFSHHPPVDADYQLNQLGRNVANCLGRQPDVWYWGHEHGVAVFASVVFDGVTFYGRCLGHGGVPFRPDNWQAPTKWTEREANFRGEGRAPNGFAELTFDGRSIVERYIREDGVVSFEFTLNI